MKFTKEIPTKPGDYAWRFNSTSGHGLVQVIDTKKGLWCLSTLSDGGCTPEERGGEWCRLVPADEVEKAYDEGFNRAEGLTHRHPLDLQDCWENSRAKRVMDGEE